MKIRVSCIQLEPKLGDKQYNLDLMEKHVHETMAKYPDTKLIVMPELAMTGYEGTREMFEQIAETLPHGEGIDRMAALAKKYNTLMTFGFAERDPENPDILYNSNVLIDENGEVLGSYRKVHPFDSEKKWCVAGTTTPVFDTSIGKLGIMICWDAAFPEIARCFALKGADLLVISTNWEDPYEEEYDPTVINKHEEDWDLMTRARAFDNTLHLVAANRIGGDGGILTFFVRSKIIDPIGQVIEALDERVEGSISAEIDLSETKVLREKYYTFFEDRVPEAYRAIVEEK